MLRRYAPELAASAWIIGCVAVTELLFLFTPYNAPLFCRFLMLPLGTIFAFSAFYDREARATGRSAATIHRFAILFLPAVWIGTLWSGYFLRVAVLEHRFNRDLAPLGDAIAAFAAKHGRMPEKPRDLSPEFISAFPEPPHPARDHGERFTYWVGGTFMQFDWMEFDIESKRWVFVPD